MTVSGVLVGVGLLFARPPPLWIADQVRNDGVTALWIDESLITLCQRVRL